MTEKNQSTIGERIRLRRSVLGITQRELANQVGVSMAAVSLWEKGNTDPGAAKLELLAKSLGCPTEWLLSGDKSYQLNRFQDQPLAQQQKDISQLESLLALLPESARLDVLNYAREKLNEHMQELKRALDNIKKQ